MLAEGRIKDRLQHLQQGLLDQTIRYVGMPSSHSPPSGLGIVTRRTGSGRDGPDNRCSRVREGVSPEGKKNAAPKSRTQACCFYCRCY